MINIKKAIINTRINIIYYQDINETIREYKVYQYGKIKLVEAKRILEKEGIEYSRILKVILEDVDLEIPIEKIDQYIID